MPTRATRPAECFTIGELARRTGASIKALRLYDRLGLLVTAGRSSANYRLFDDDAVLCVGCVKALQAAGLSLREMRDLASAYRPGGNFRDTFSHKLEEALERTETKLARLESSRAALSELLRLTGAVRSEGEIARLLTLPHGSGSNLVRDGSGNGVAARSAGGRV